jgi:hypothetical protein
MASALRAFHVEIGTARQRANMRQHRIDRVGRSGDRAVDAFMRDQQRAFDATPAAQLRERGAFLLQPVQRCELVERGDVDRQSGRRHGGVRSNKDASPIVPPCARVQIW